MCSSDLIKVEDKRDKPVPKFEEVKDQIEQFMYRKSQQDVIMALRSAGKVERLDAPPAAPALLLWSSMPPLILGRAHARRRV